MLKVQLPKDQLLCVRSVSGALACTQTPTLIAPLGPATVAPLATISDAWVDPSLVTTFLSVLTLLTTAGLFYKV